MVGSYQGLDIKEQVSASLVASFDVSITLSSHSFLILRIGTTIVKSVFNHLAFVSFEMARALAESGGELSVPFVDSTFYAIEKLTLPTEHCPDIELDVLESGGSRRCKAEPYRATAPLASVLRLARELPPSSAGAAVASCMF